MKVIPPGAKIGDSVKNKAGETYTAYLKCEGCGAKQSGSQPKPSVALNNAQLDRIERKLDALMHFQGMNGNIVSQ